MGWPILDGQLGGAAQGGDTLPEDSEPEKAPSPSIEPSRYDRESLSPRNLFEAYLRSLVAETNRLFNSPGEATTDLSVTSSGSQEDSPRSSSISLEDYLESVPLGLDGFEEGLRLLEDANDALAASVASLASSAAGGLTATEMVSKTKGDPPNCFQRGAKRVSSCASLGTRAGLRGLTLSTSRTEP